MSKGRRFGPGLLVTAAFIGPGTVTTATRAGAAFGFALLWAVVFAIVATIFLQEMSARLGLVTRQGLGEAVRSTFQQQFMRFLSCVLVASAIGFGNAAYQTGNITGASIGLSLLSNTPRQVWAITLGMGAFALLLSGRYKLIERVLIVLVVLMSVMFIVTAVLVRPDPGKVVEGTFVPSIPHGSLLTVVALVGTTVVPYNLFLHASSVREKWPDSVPTEQALKESRFDTVMAVVLGGTITAAIVTTAAVAFFGRSVTPSADEMARQLEPLLGGPAAKIAFASGFVSAGLTSAITAPLAAAYAVSGVFGWNVNLKSWAFRAVWMVVLTAGTVFAAMGMKSPETTILLAQAANGVLLPLIAVFLLSSVNRRDLMGAYRNGWGANLVGVLVVLVAAILGVMTLLTQVFGVF